MPLLSRLDAVIVLLAGATGMAIVEDHNRTKIPLPQPAELSAPMTLETCIELAEYRRRALRVMTIMAGGLPDTDTEGQAKSIRAACAAAISDAPVRSDEPARD
jgi:hypothetical protein